MSYLGIFSKEELEKLKRRLCDPSIDESLNINITYVAPFTSLGDNDELVRGIIFTYNNESEDKTDSKGRSR